MKNKVTIIKEEYVDLSEQVQQLFDAVHGLYHRSKECENIPNFIEGGIVRGRYEINDESGPEAIIPLDQLKELLKSK